MEAAARAKILTILTVLVDDDLDVEQAVMSGADVDCELDLGNNIVARSGELCSYLYTNPPLGNPTRGL